MQSGPRLLHWDTPMPQTPLRQHHESPKRGDNKGAMRRARGGQFDGNLTVMAGHIWFAHWTTPARNGYTRVVDARTGRIRRMKLRERRRPGNKWGAAGIRRWRRPNGEHPLTFDEGIAYAAAHGAVCIGELKSPAFALSPTYAARAVQICMKHDHPAWFKTLYNMRYPRGKTARVQAAGGSVALIFGPGIRGRLRRLAASRRVTSKWGTVRPTATW